MQPGTATEQGPNNVRSKTTGGLEIRKLWHVQEAKFIYGLFVEYIQQTAKLREEIVTENGEEKTVSKPDWDDIEKEEIGFTSPQGYMGDEEWAKRTAEHFDIELPTEEYKEPEVDEDGKE